MINAFIGKLQGDGSVAFIYCHDHGDMSRLGQTLMTEYSDEKKLEDLLEKGHCGYPGNNEKNIWKLANNKQYVGGEQYCYCDSRKEYLEKAIDEVQAAYLMVKGKWRYANAMSTTPGFVAVQKIVGGNLTKVHNSERKFKDQIGSGF